MRWLIRRSPYRVADGVCQSKRLVVGDRERMVDRSCSIDMVCGEYQICQHQVIRLLCDDTQIVTNTVQYALAVGYTMRRCVSLVERPACME